MTTPHDQLTALHELAKSCPGGVEGCEWWPQDIRESNQYEDVFEIEDELGNWVPISGQHGLDLVTAEAERWLRARGWNLLSPGYEHEREWELDPENTGYLSLHEALKYAMEQSTTTQAKEH